MQIADSAAVKELEPELNKLKNKACQKVRDFILDKINILKKPKTNITIIQKNVLIVYKVFTEFLKEHYIDVYVDICNQYQDTLGN